jgi:DNA adenine methylase
MDTDKPGRPALRWHGGKWRLADWIISHFPRHTTYVEPYGGSASVLLSKDPSTIEVYNDINSLAVNFFRVLRDRPEDLMRAIELTPYSREEFAGARVKTEDPVESARRLAVWCWQGRGRGGVNEPGGWRFMKTDSRDKTPVDDWNNMDHLWTIARRLKQAHIEHDDALKVIQRFDTPSTLFYVDPPYVQETRSERWRDHAYTFEYSDAQHTEMLKVLQQVEGYVVLSGYSSNLYDGHLAGWKVVEKETTKDSNGGATEILWISPRTWEALQGIGHFPLFKLAQLEA